MLRATWSWLCLWQGHEEQSHEAARIVQNDARPPPPPNLSTLFPRECRFSSATSRSRTPIADFRVAGSYRRRRPSSSDDAGQLLSFRSPSSCSPRYTDEAICTLGVTLGFKLVHTALVLGGVEVCQSSTCHYALWPSKPELWRARERRLRKHTVQKRGAICY